MVPASRRSVRALSRVLGCACLGVSAAWGADLAAAAARMDADAAAGRPLVAHVVVALVDNEHQGIVPVPAALGDGGAPRSNLYGGALYGVRTYFRRHAEWRALPIPPSTDARVLDRVLFHRVVERGGARADAYLVAEAWRGERIADAIRHFLAMNRGEHVESIAVGGVSVEAGGAAHVVAFIGHNGLMDFPAPTLAHRAAKPAPHASIVLACYSDSYFGGLLSADSAPLLTTTGLMAPEAYTLDAALERWFSGASPADVRSAAARAYARYQKIAERAALRLFRTQSAAGAP